MAGSIPIDQLKAEDTYGIPQQSMNEKGLFCSGAETEIVPEDSARAGIPRYDGVVTDLILRQAASVPEALQLLKSRDYWMREGQLLCADRSGESFILEAGKVVLRERAVFRSLPTSFSREIRRRRIAIAGTRLSMAD